MAIAALPMYDLPELRGATDRCWAFLRDRLRAGGLDAPETLDRALPLDTLWTRPDLLFAQTCGRPYATSLRGVVRLLGTPCYAAEGCDGPRYRSWLVVRDDDPAGELGALAGRRVAINAADSQSGHHALRAALAAAGLTRAFLGPAIVTGAHRASLLAVAARDADLCAVDCVTWALLRRHAPTTLAGLRRIGTTPDAPGLPLVTGAATPRSARAALSRALRAMLDAPELAACRNALLLQDIAPLRDADYDTILAIERNAATVAPLV